MSKKLCVVAFSELAVSVPVRSCMIELPEDYDFDEDCGDGGVGSFKKLRELFYEAVKGQCSNCKAIYDDFIPDYIKIIGVFDKGTFEA